LSVDPFTYLPPDSTSNFRFGIEGFSLGDILGPEIGNIDPVGFGEEKWVTQDDVTDDGVEFGFAFFGAVFLNGGSKGRVIGCAIFFAKGIPSQGEREKGMADEKATSHDVVIWTVEFEQKGRAGVDGFENSIAPGLLEVDFVGGAFG
jgi:hypothetical protein